jgi:hypothetical protein
MKNEKTYLKKIALDSFADEDAFYHKLKKSTKSKKGVRKLKNRDSYEDNF